MRIIPCFIDAFLVTTAAKVVVCNNKKLKDSAKKR
jgi:hypothetical protein